MWTLIFLLLMIAVFGKLIFFAVKMTWGVTKILFTLVFFPLILIGLVMAGLMHIALPILLVVGIITWFVKTVF